MRSRFLALPATAFALLLGAGAATASASTIQAAGQAALNGQLAVSLANAAQHGAVNASTPLRLLSPGHSAGATGQFNSSSANSAAGNANRALQSVVQSAAGSGGAPIQAAGQQAGNAQGAISTATSTQTGATNRSVPIRILSPGSSTGSVVQGNTSEANSGAGNRNETAQSVGQGVGSGGAGIGAGQFAGQSAGSFQLAGSRASSTQTNPSNVNVPIRILSPGSDTGSVLQANNSAANSGAGNLNHTHQSIDQSQGGGLFGGLGVQGAGQSANNGQFALSGASSTQTSPSNVDVPIRILSPGSDTGSVTQFNGSSANSAAGNANSTGQSIDQSQGGGLFGGLGLQAAGQSANNGQFALSGASSTQTNPSNVNVPIRILSPGSDTGSVTQFNGSSANSAAGNANSTGQSILQFGGFAV